MRGAGCNKNNEPGKSPIKINNLFPSNHMQRRLRNSLAHKYNNLGLDNKYSLTLTLVVPGRPREARSHGPPY